MSEYLKSIAPEGRAQFFFVTIIGVLLLFYIFASPLSKQGININISMVTFLMLIGTCIFLVGFLISRLGQTGSLTAQEWFMFLFAAAAVVMIFVFFPGLIPAEFRGSIMSVQSVMGMLPA